MTVKVFAYKGALGVTAIDSIDFNNKTCDDVILNNPFEDGQLGFICDASKCEFSSEAIEILKRVPKSNDAIGDVMCYPNGTKQVFGWLGSPMFCSTEPTTSLESCRDSDFSNLVASDVEIPEDFIKYIDSLDA